MNKRRVISVQILFEDGEVKHYGQLNAMFSESLNARKSHGFKNSESWNEFHLSWISAIDVETIDVVSTKEIEPVEKRSHGKEEIWCSPHDCPPSECFASHNPPTAFSGREPNWKDEVIQAGKPGLMRAYGLTSESLERWFELEDRAKKPLMEEFDISDLLGGYGNGKV